MKKIKVVTVGLAVLALFTGLGRGQGLTLNFGNNEGTAIEFGGNADTFQFTTAQNGYQWNITSESGGSSAVGLLGSITGGPFVYGPITYTFGGSVQSATVLGPLGELVISDGTAQLTGTVNLIDITTLFQSVGVINASVSINVSGITYTGTNPDLRYLAANQPASLDLGFTFNPGLSLSQLSSGAGGYDAPYSGSISTIPTVTVPEPAGMMLAIFGGLSILWFSRRK
jgi:hypothetical protein